MVAANKAIANQLKADKPGPFVTHAGIRRDKAMKPKSFLHDTYPRWRHGFRDHGGFSRHKQSHAASGERPLRAMIND